MIGDAAPTTHHFSSSDFMAFAELPVARHWGLQPDWLLHPLSILKTTVDSVKLLLPLAVRNAKIRMA